jgi:hypothetical protein
VVRAVLDQQTKRTERNRTMAKYVFAYRGGAGMAATPEEQQKAMQVWMSWFGSLGDAVADPGNPFGPSSSVASDGSVARSGAASLTGYSVITADNLAQAAGLAKGCPILEGGGSVDVYETIAMARGGGWNLPPALGPHGAFAPSSWMIFVLADFGRIRARRLGISRLAPRRGGASGQDGRPKRMLADPLYQPSRLDAVRPTRRSVSGPTGRLTGRLLGSIALAGGVVAGGVTIPSLASTSVASGAGFSYTGPPPIVQAIEALLGRVGFTCMYQPQADPTLTCTGKIGSFTVTISVPAGIFPTGTQVVVTDSTAPSGGAADPPAPLPAGLHRRLLGFGIGFFEHGRPVTPPPGAVTASVSGPGIGSDTRLLRLEGSRLQSVSSAVSGGTTTFGLGGSPNFELATSAPAPTHRR